MSSGARPASAPGSRSGSPSRKSIDSREGSRHATPPITPGSTDFLSPTGEPYGRHKKPALNMSFSNLADTFNPHNYRSESHVLRHYKSSTSMGGENTKTSYEKVVNDKAQAKSEKAQAKKERASHSAPTTPKGSGTIGTAKQALGMRKKPKKPKVDQQELFITMHVAQILARQDFILRLARALMMWVIQ